MSVIGFLLRNQIMLGMLCALFLFVPWQKRRRFFVPRLICSVAAAICLSEFAPIPMPFRLLAFFAAIVLIVWVCFRCSWEHVLFSATCTYCVQHMTSKIAYLVLVLWRHFDYVYVTFNYALLVLGLLLLSNVAVLVPMYIFGTRRFLSGELRFGSLKTLIYTMIFIICAVFLSYYAERALGIDSPGYTAGYASLNGLCALFACIVLMVNFSNSRGELLTEEKRTLERLLEKDRQQYEAAKKNMERINIHYHDIKKRRGMAMSLEEAQKFDDELKNFKTLYYTGNKVVDITLSEKASLCADVGIQFVCSAEGKRLDMIKPYQIYSLLGNAIDNAIESLRSVEDREKRVIRLDIFGRGDMSVIRVVNYMARAPKMADGIPVTTKPDTENHGFGIKSIKNIAEEYGGMVYIGTEDHEFTLVVAIPYEPHGE